MSTLTASKTIKQERVSYSRLLWVGPVAAVTAAIANLVVFLIVQNLLEITLIGPAGPGSTEMAPLPAIAVIIASIVPAVAATLLLAVLGKFLARPIQTFWIISIVFLILSFAPPLGLPVDAATKVVMGLMHVVAAIAIVGVLTAFGRAR
jgi:hypothetical protein